MRRPAQWSTPILSLRCRVRVRAVLEEEACDFHVSTSERHARWCLPVAVHGCHVRTVSEKDAKELSVFQW